MASKEADAGSLLGFFLGRFDLKKATDAELSFLAGASEEASHAAQQLADLTRGLGCVLDEDQSDSPGDLLPTKDLPGLLWQISSSLEAIAQMAFIGHEAAFVLGERRNGMVHEGVTHD